MKHYLLFLGLSILTTLFGCQKDKKCPNVRTTYLEEEMKDWILFDSGSYWVYIDSVTGAYDSVYVTKSGIEIVEFIDPKYSKCPELIFESITVYLESSNNKRFVVNGAYGRGSGVINNVNPVNGYVAIHNQKYSGGDGGRSHYMYFPVLQGTVGAWNGFTIIEHDTIYPEYEVFGKTYQNVLLVSDGYNGALNAITKFYHVKNTGVIRKEIYKFKGFHDAEPLELLHVWELADYKVSQ